MPLIYNLLMVVTCGLDISHWIRGGGEDQEVVGEDQGVVVEYLGVMG